MAKTDYWRRVNGEGPDDPLRIPTMDTAERNTMTPEYGFTIYNSDNHLVQTYTPVGWTGIAYGETQSTAWNTRNLDFNAQVGLRYRIDTSANTVLMILPPNPSVGDGIEFLDLTGSFATNNLTIERSGNLIVGAAENLICDIPVWVKISFIGGTTGWTIATLS